MSPRDQACILGLNSNKNGLLVLQSNYEDGLAFGPALQLHGTTDAPKKLLDAGTVSYSTLCAADYDSDGDLDLFVGGRCRPGIYPSPVASVILRNDSGQFVKDDKHAALLSKAGSVSAAVWTDLLGDHHPELVLACDPGLIRVYRNISGSLREVTAELGLEDRVGFWNSIAAGDFNGDGNMDLVAGNIGTNSEYELYVKDGITWHHGDLSGGGVHEVFESYNGASPGKVLPIRNLAEVLRAIPFLRELYPTYAAYANAASTNILGRTKKQTGRHPAHLA